MKISSVVVAMILFWTLQASSVIVNAQDTGFGCYSIDTNRCTCTADVCTESACVATGGIFTPDCVSCQCADEAEGEDSVVEEETETTVVPSVSTDDDFGNITVDFGSKYGCFGTPSSPLNCDCSAELCSKDSCSVSAFYVP